MSLQPRLLPTSVPSSPSFHSSATRFTHLRDFLPFNKHATFHVNLVIHELQSVPFVSGEFRIKWKFKDLQAVSRDGRPLSLGRTLALKLEKRKTSNHTQGKGKQKEALFDELGLLDSEKDSVPPISTQYPSADDSVVPDLLNTPVAQKQRSSSPHSSSISDPQASSSSNQVNGPVEFNNTMRGYTPYLPLTNFKVIFGTEINAAVQMSIEKETLVLLPSSLKLTVTQLVVSGDPGAPLNPRLGHIELNLAEYANAGPVTRRYLLRRSKVNALLKLTLTVTQMSGEKNYRAPPLRKEEIKANLMDFINKGKPPSPPMFSCLDEDPWLEGILPEIFRVDEEEEVQPEESPPIPQICIPPVKPRKRWRGDKIEELKSMSTPPTTVKPAARELSHTEMLIEAIFNPFPTSLDEASPFTYHATFEPIPKLVKNGSLTSTSEGPGTDGTSRGSFDSSQRISASGSELGHDAGSSAGGASVGGSSNGRSWWRRKIGQDSRPTTPSLVTT